MKVFENSLLELPIRLLWAIFPFLKDYYQGMANTPDAYEHFYTGLGLSLILCWATLVVGKVWLLFGIFLAWFGHYVVKEIIVDGHKHVFKKDCSAEEWMNFKADSLTRNGGFVFALPFVVVTIARIVG